ncbi:MAG: cadmium-transporting ATPase, partial [Ignavibacteriales bacterium]|nr:cadmium-transporting ATPase [Ignavibacteriales bacterium]
IVLGIFGWTSLWLAILADDGATLLVILNSLRLLKTK